MNELLRNFTGDKENISTKFGREFALEMVGFLRDKIRTFQEESGNLYNLEATPAEGTTYRFAKEDKKRYPDIIQAGEGGQYLLHKLQPSYLQISQTTLTKRLICKMSYKAPTLVAPSFTYI